MDAVTLQVFTVTDAWAAPDGMDFVALELGLPDGPIRSVSPLGALALNQREC
ncbi:MAG TPA: hypothetical protein VJ839_00475 [Candidatus Limnocylindria bacterium]|nr:hypothetical protein [Candidatus Limnocylindria bacterium]